MPKKHKQKQKNGPKNKSKSLNKREIKLTNLNPKEAKLFKSEHITKEEINQLINAVNIGYFDFGDDEEEDMEENKTTRENSYF